MENWLLYYDCGEIKWLDVEIKLLYRKLRVLQWKEDKNNLCLSKILIYLVVHVTISS